MEPSNEVYIEQVIRQRFPELDADQVARVNEIAVAHSLKNQGRLPNIGGIVRLIRSQPARLTPVIGEAPPDFTR
jgi:hypothetical protein